MRLKYASIEQIENGCYCTGGRVFNSIGKRHGPSCVKMEEEKKGKEYHGMWGTLAVMEEVAEEDQSPR